MPLCLKATAKGRNWCHPGIKGCRSCPHKVGRQSLWNAPGIQSKAQMRLKWCQVLAVVFSLSPHAMLVINISARCCMRRASTWHNMQSSARMQCQHTEREKKQDDVLLQAILGLCLQLQELLTQNKLTQLHLTPWSYTDLHTLELCFGFLQCKAIHSLISGSQLHEVTKPANRYLHIIKPTGTSWKQTFLESWDTHFPSTQQDNCARHKKATHHHQTLWKTLNSSHGSMACKRSR